MAFRSKCASESLHKGWGISQYDDLTAKVPINIRNKLLQLCQKSMRSNYHITAPKFCNLCIEKVLIGYPDLHASNVTPDHTYVGPPLAKRAQLSDDLVSKSSVQTQTDSNTNMCDMHTQTSNVVIDLQDISTLENLSKTQLGILAFHLGRLETQNIKTDSMLLSNSKNLDTMINIDPVQYLAERNSTVVQFLLGIEDKHVDSQFSKNRQYLLCKTVESILNLSASHLLLPLHFRESVLLYSLTGSKLALSVLGSGGPYGSYQQVKAFLNNLPVKKELYLDGDVLFAFDNNQILHRQWSVKIDGKFQCHIVTMFVVFELNTTGRLQWNSEYVPGKWMTKQCDELKYVKFIDQLPEVKKTHYEEHLYPYLTSVIATVAREQETTIGDLVVISDDIDRTVAQNKYAECYNTCYACGEKSIPKTKVNCPSCKQNIKQSKRQALGESDKTTYETRPAHQYDSTGTGPHRCFRVEFKRNSMVVNEMDVDGEAQSSAEAVKIQVSQPVFVNPCSYDACLTVLRTIGEKAGVKRYGSGTREWVSVCCDGSPYVLCLRIILSTYICNVCGVSMQGLNEINKHMDIHIDCLDAIYDLEFNWVMLIPGPGHLEMNMLRSLVELCWEIFWRPMVILLNFRSENAQKAQKRVNDHHKGWQLLTIARNALAKELVLPFVRYQMAQEVPDLSVVNLMRYISRQVKDQNYLLIADITFEFIDAINMYRMGVRTGQHNLMFAGTAKISKIWSARHHPSYREIEMAHSLMMARLPAEILQHLTTSSSINTSGKLATNEGADLKLEQINKQTQHWIPKVPTGKDWEMICGNYDTLTVLREKTFKQIETKDPKFQNEHKQKDISKEEHAFRALLREKKYLIDPFTPKTLVSLDGHTLDPMLTSLMSQAREKRAHYYDVYMEHESVRSCFRTTVPCQESPVFVTPQEREQYMAITSRTIAELKVMISDKLECISVDDMRDAFQDAYMSDVMKRKNVKKQDYIDFLYEISDYLEDEDFYVQQLADDCDDNIT